MAFALAAPQPPDLPRVCELAERLEHDPDWKELEPTDLRGAGSIDRYGLPPAATAIGGTPCRRRKGQNRAWTRIQLSDVSRRI